MKLKVINDTGATHGTRVLTESGVDISKYITGMTLHFIPGKPVTADVVMKNIGVEVLAELGAVITEPGKEADDA